MDRILTKNGFRIKGKYYIPQNAEFAKSEIGNTFTISQDAQGCFLTCWKYGRVECRIAQDIYALNDVGIRKILHIHHANDNHR